MDLIYTDKRARDVGVLWDYEMDLAFGSDENYFECTIDLGSHCCEPGCFLYLEGTEYGGIVDMLRVDTGSGNVTYGGRTWHGILESKILSPDTGQDYLVLNGDANVVLQSLITRMGLAGLFQASADPSGLKISSYKMPRYVRGYSGIRKMLAAVGGKLSITYQNGLVMLAALPLTDYSQDADWDSSQIDYVIENNKRPMNHLVCLGTGDLKDREVIHLYADEAGNISGTQSFIGLDEIMEIYDCPDAKSSEELAEGGRERLAEAYAEAETLEVNFDSEADYGIGDIVGAREQITGVSVAREITKKIVKINQKGMSIQCQIGE